MRPRQLLLTTVGTAALLIGIAASVIVWNGHRSTAPDAPAHNSPSAEPESASGGLQRSVPVVEPRADPGSAEERVDVTPRTESGSERPVVTPGGMGRGSRARVTPAPRAVTNRRYRVGSGVELDWAVTAGEWTIDGDRAVATAGEGKIDVALTVPTYYAEIERMTIRGGIAAESSFNFRVQAGPVSLIFNWELARENHYRIGTRRSESGPPALIPGNEHEIVLEQKEELIHLSVDGVELWKAKGKLHGPVTVYPALGSSIFVSEILIRGRAVPEVEVTGPAYPLQ